MTERFQSQSKMSSFLKKYPRKTLIRFFSIQSFNALCLLGFVYQVEMISYSFFKYETVTRIDNKIRESMAAPNLALCFRYIDIVDKARLKRDANIIMNPKKTLQAVTENESKLTVEQIMEFSPPANNCINWCLYRQGDSVRINTYHSHNECARYWKIDKFYMQEFICYRFGKKHNDNYTFEVVAHSLQYTHTLFGIGMMKTFNSVESFMAIVYYGKYPYVSRDYTSITSRSKVASNKYYLTFSRTNYLKQPAPYDSMCIPGVSLQDKYTCMRDCLRNRLSKIGRVPFSEMFDKRWPYKHINMFDLQNETTFQLLNESNNACLDKCEATACYGDFTTTYLTGATDTNLKTISYRVRIPQTPLTVMKSNPKLVLQDFVIYLCSCFGVWFGISLYHFNPFPKLFDYIESRPKGKKKNLHNSNRRRCYSERHPISFEYPLENSLYLHKLKY